MPSYQDESYRGVTDQCYACIVGVATGPESHSEGCPFRDIPMPDQDGTFGPEWDDYDHKVKVRRDELDRERREALEGYAPKVTLDDVAGILGPDWTGGLDSVEWVRRQRDDD